MAKIPKIYTHKEISLVDAGNLEELLANFKVDTDIWDIDKYVVNIWGNSNNPSHQVKAWLKKKIINVDNKQDFVRELVKELKQYSVQIPPKKRKLQVERNVLLVNLTDLHLGRLSWAVETGFGNYDIKIATEIVNEAVDVILKRAAGFAIEKIIFFIGGDYFNYNTSNPFPQTIHGTPQESDVRQRRMFRIGRKLACKQIERFAEHAEVEVIMVGGNHDEELLFGLGEVLEVKYENNSNIVIDNSPKLRKYINFGSTLLGVTHGMYEKRNDLPMLMSNEAKKNWEHIDHKYFHTGHRHHEIVEDKQGVLILTAPTPAEVDDYETKKGYTLSNRAIKAWIYNWNDGEIASITHNIKSKY